MAELAAATARRYCPDLVTSAVAGRNGALTFAVGSSGSKAGWVRAEEHESALSDLAAELRGIPLCSFVVVNYGDERGGDRVVEV